MNRRHRRPLDDRLLDALGEIEGTSYEGAFWRVVRKGRDVFDGSRGSGRWNSAEMSVLYGTNKPNGALAEIHFHISRGQPIFPSRIAHELHHLEINTAQTLRLADMDLLESLGVEASRYQELLYGRTQEIASAAQFMGFDGLIAPSARWNCETIVLFLDAIDLDEVEIVSRQDVDWDEWRKQNQPR